MYTLIIKYFDFTISLLQRFDRFLAKAAAVDPEIVRTHPKRYLTYAYLLYYINNILFWLLRQDVKETRRRIRWQRAAGIPFDPKNFRSNKTPLRR
jgi:hypothetical protein